MRGINLIKKLRVNNEMTQMQLAKACGVTQGAVVCWENGTGFPKAEKILTVARVLNCEADALLHMAEERQQNRIAARG